MVSNRLISIEVIPYKSFKEKIRLTKKFKGCTVEVMDHYIIVTKVVRVNEWIM